MQGHIPMATACINISFMLKLIFEISGISWDLKEKMHSFKQIKMVYRAKQRILNKAILNGLVSPKEMSNTFSHQENENLNNPEIPPHTSQSG